MMGTRWTLEIEAQQIWTGQDRSSATTTTSTRRAAIEAVTMPTTTVLEILPYSWHPRDDDELDLDTYLDTRPDMEIQGSPSRRQFFDPV